MSKKKNTFYVNSIVIKECGLYDIEKMPPQAKAHGEAIARLFMWTSPLHEAGHVTTVKNSINLDLVVAKRFFVGRNKHGNPTLEAQPSEMMWLRNIPWVSAGVNMQSNRIFLFARPCEPFRDFIVTIPVDHAEKIAHFAKAVYLDIHLLQVKGATYTALDEPVLRIALAVSDEGGGGSKKMKNKPSGV